MATIERTARSSLAGFAASIVVQGAGTRIVFMDPRLMISVRVDLGR
jgi:hypothetical protein